MKNWFLFILIFSFINCYSQKRDIHHSVKRILPQREYKTKLDSVVELNVDQLERRAKKFKIATYSMASVSVISLISSFVACDKILDWKTDKFDVSDMNQNYNNAKTVRTALLCVSGAAAITTVGLLIKYIDIKQDITFKKISLQAGVLDNGNIGLALNF